MHRTDRIAMITAMLCNRTDQSGSIDVYIDNLIELAVHIDRRVCRLLDAPEFPVEEIDLLSTYEVADLLAMSPGSLQNWRHAGKGPLYIKLGSKVMYKKSDIHKFIQDHLR